MTDPKILYMDIETSPCLAYVWGCGKQIVQSKQIKKDRKIITISYSWNDDKKVINLQMNLKRHKINLFDDDADKQMLIKFSAIYSKADLVVAHNGRKFDVARLRARLVVYGLPDLMPVLFDDSYTFVKGIDFTSHKLDFLGKILKNGQKDSIGYDAWIDVMEGNQKALDKMSKYNARDVVLLRKNYKKLVPYAKSKINNAIFNGDSRMCPKLFCGGINTLIVRGYTHTKLGKFTKYQCKKCHTFCQKGNNSIKNTKEYAR